MPTREFLEQHREAVRAALAAEINATRRYGEQLREVAERMVQAGGDSVPVYLPAGHRGLSMVQYLVDEMERQRTQAEEALLALAEEVSGGDLVQAARAMQSPETCYDAQLEENRS